MEYQRVELSGGKQGYRKFLPGGGSACFLAEAQGLEAMEATNTVSTPAVVRRDDVELVTEFITSGRETEEGWEMLGRQLASMHAQPQSTFGFTGDNYCGATPQINTPCIADGFEFFAEYRLHYQARLARDKALLEDADMHRVAAIARRLPELVPPQPPALLHGDLWHGNVLFSADSRVYLIDPACYWGWPEAELGMTALFSGFDAIFYAAYSEQAPLQPGWRERLPLYNLYHLLNHLNLFGASYHPQVRALLARYA